MEIRRKEKNDQKFASEKVAEEVAKLKESKEAYEHSVEILKRELDKSKNTPEGDFGAIIKIKKYQNQAFGLKHFGEDIKKVFEEIENDNKYGNGFQHGNVPEPPRCSKKLRLPKVDHEPMPIVMPFGMISID